MVNPYRFYTYAYLREDKTPYYIGKGQKERVYYRNRRGVKPPKDKSRIIFLKQNLNENEAFKHEKYMIAVFGRKDLGTGILHNRTDGGEGVSGFIRDEKHRRKISERQLGEKNHNYGKSFSDETRRKMSIANKGKVLSEEHKEKIGQANKGKPLTEEHKRKLSEANKNKKWWNDGCGNTVFAVECPPNYYKGRGKLHLESN
jgi:hypothetical protein